MMGDPLQNLFGSIDADPQPVQPFDEADLADMADHQLVSPIDVERIDPSLSPVTLEQLLSEPAPSLQVLTAVKERAKLAASEPLPGRLTQMVYLVAVAMARVKRSARITSLSDPELRRATRWMLVQPWVPDPVRPLLRDYLSVLELPGKRVT
jgi:hypothetical protein